VNNFHTLYIIYRVEILQKEKLIYAHTYYVTENEKSFLTFFFSS